MQRRYIHNADNPNKQCRCWKHNTEWIWEWYPKPHIGNGRYKIRIKNNSNNKGKSGGYRVITYAKIKDTVLLVYIYAKSDTQSISDTKIDNIIKNYNSHL